MSSLKPQSGRERPSVEMRAFVSDAPEEFADPFEPGRSIYCMALRNQSSDGGDGDGSIGVVLQETAIVHLSESSRER
ncbi:hypothetical protein Ciccas_002786 [Cichlidogyrus casuarinus]|uniref:Uncharacterized protein n=1 Tax=Cichlidogyrus casuarinus TaxID=1844966 RepID=A0ABD2QG83_9PLAT